MKKDFLKLSTLLLLVIGLSVLSSCGKDDELPSGQSSYFLKINGVPYYTWSIVGQDVDTSIETGGNWKDKWGSISYQIIWYGETDDTGEDHCIFYFIIHNMTTLHQGVDLANYSFVLNHPFINKYLDYDYTCKSGSVILNGVGTGSTITFKNAKFVCEEYENVTPITLDGSIQITNWDI